MFFLMLTGGIPPFKSAATTDKWFKCIAGKVQEKFWKKQKKAAKKIKETCGEKMGLAAELFFWMCAYQPTERATLQDCSTHEWFNHEVIYNFFVLFFSQNIVFFVLNNCTERNKGAKSKHANTRK